MDFLPGMELGEIVRWILFGGFIIFAARRQLRSMNRIMGRNKPPIPVPSLITCPNCRQMNAAQAVTCKHCGTSLMQSSGTLAPKKQEDDRSVPPLVKKL